jgi:LacI family transcriptional regulator
MREGSHRAWVAISSVSRVRSGHPDATPQMRRVVMHAVRNLGYRSEMLAHAEPGTIRLENG